MKKLLIVEDDIFLVRVYAAKFIDLGYDVDILEDGVGVVESIKKSSPDLILLDLVMPIKDGFTVLKELKSSNEYKHIPVVALTNLSSDEDKAMALDYGAAHFLTKSTTSFDDVAKLVNSLVPINN